MNSIRRLIVIVFLLSGLIVLSYSQAPVKLNGSEGMALLESLTKDHQNANNASLNNASLNNASLNLNATNSSTKSTIAKNSSGDFWSWGTRPKDLPMGGQAQSGDDYLSDSA